MWQAGWRRQAQAQAPGLQQPVLLEGGVNLSMIPLANRFEFNNNNYVWGPVSTISRMISAGEGGGWLATPVMTKRASQLLYQ